MVFCTQAEEVVGIEETVGSKGAFQLQQSGSNDLGFKFECRTLKTDFIRKRSSSCKLAVIKTKHGVWSTISPLECSCFLAILFNCACWT
jgi:hypothetical protein